MRQELLVVIRDLGYRRYTQCEEFETAAAISGSGVVADLIDANITGCLQLHAF